MKRYLKTWFLRGTALLAGVLTVSSLAMGATPYVVANDDVIFPFLSGVSFYQVGSNGQLTLQQRVFTGGFGIGGGFFGANRIAVLNSGGQACVYASDAQSGDIVGIAVSSLSVGGTAQGSKTDAGTSNGIGLAMNSQYLYASFTDSNTIGTFRVQSGCGLSFVKDTAVVGAGGGIINGMATHGNILIATYSDGSIESFDLSGGVPLSNGDKQYSTAAVESRDATYPNSIDITSDGHYAIFGDTSTAVVVEVSDISSGKLTPTVVHRSEASISSSNIMLSPDETLLYVINSQGARVTAFYFDKSTGKVSGGCASGPLRGVSQEWSYLGGLGLIKQTGNGGGVYVAEYGSQSAITMLTFHASGQKCWFNEAVKSQAFDPKSSGLLSIGTFPPRSF